LQKRPLPDHSGKSYGLRGRPRPGQRGHRAAGRL